MYFSNTNKQRLGLKQVLATALLLVVLLSSCSIKRGIKVLFDIPVNTVQTGNFGTRLTPASLERTACLKCADLQIITADSFGNTIVQKLSPAVLLSVVLSLLLIPFLRSEDKHYYQIPNFGKRIPKYLLYSKLLFYDLR